jgi:hypothetical protein
MKVIMLSGRDNCGKSTTLNLLYEEVKPAKDEDIISPKNILGNPKNRDFECIIRYENKTVAFFTMGDYSPPLCSVFTKYNKLNCDILVCACNKKFDTPYERICNYPHVIIDKITTQCVADHEYANNIDKNKILMEISK